MQFFKKNDMAIYWIVIVLAMVFSAWKNGIIFALSGVLAGAIIMELVAKGSFCLLKGDDEEENNEETNEQKEVQEETKEEDNITDYVNKNKRAFSEANTYLAAAIGAIIGWKLTPVLIVLAILLQVVLIIPQFIKNLYEEKKYRLAFSITAFCVLGIAYLIMTNITKPNFYVACTFALLMIFFAFDSIIKLRERVSTQGYCEIPFGSFLIASAIITWFYGAEILTFCLKYLFRIG